VIGNIAQFWRLTRELDIQGLRNDFERHGTLYVLGTDAACADRVARLIDPDPDGSGMVVGVLAEASVALAERHSDADAVVVALCGAMEPSARRALNELSLGDEPLLLVQVDGGAGVVVVGVPEERVVSLGSDEADEDARDRLLGALVRSAPNAMLPLGRRYPRLRDAVSRHLIRDASRVNAQFAAISSLPATLPLVGGLVGDMADMLVLTKNQVILLFKLAGLYGRDLDLGRQLVAEVLPVVGGAFVWRTTARALVGLLPPILGLLPKTIVAYSGTFLVGEMARYYYQHGRKPPPELIKDLRAEAITLARSILKPRGQ
jgi:uncharacterized protein (DUF697 family)